MLNRNRNPLGLFLIPLFLVASAGSCARHEKKADEVAAAPPKLEVVEKQHDFGNATEGDRLSYTFKFKNTGAGKLVIDRVSTSCGCLAAVLKQKEVEPGGEGQIDVTFDTNRRGGDNRKTLTIQSNDPTSPRTEIEVRAKVETLLAFDPAFVRLNPEYGKQQVLEAWVTGKLKDEAKLKIVPSIEKPDVTIELAQRKIEDGGVQSGIRFSIVGKKVGFGNGTVVVETGLAKPDKIQLGYHWTVAGNVQVVPSQVYFSARNSANNERVIRVSSRRPDFKLRDAKVIAGPFAARIAVPDAGTGYEVHVTLQKEVEPTVGAGAAEIGKLELISNDPLEPKKEIPLRLAPQFAPGAMRQGPGGLQGPTRPRGAAPAPSAN